MAKKSKKPNPYYTTPMEPTEERFASLLEAVDREEQQVGKEVQDLKTQTQALNVNLRQMREGRSLLLDDLEKFRAGCLQPSLPFGNAAEEDQAGSGWEPDPDVEAGDLGGEVEK